MQGLPVLFTHAGFRPEMLSHAENACRKLTGASLADPEHIARYVNQRVIETVEAGRGGKCSFQDTLFQAGPERGGNDVGGPFWTDYSVLAKADESAQSSPRMVQIVGHSIGYNKIRTTRLMQTIGA